MRRPKKGPPPVKSEHVVIGIWISQWYGSLPALFHDLQHGLWATGPPPPLLEPSQPQLCVSQLLPVAENLDKVPRHCDFLLRTYFTKNMISIWWVPQDFFRPIARFTSQNRPVLPLIFFSASQVSKKWGGHHVVSRSAFFFV